MRRWFAGCSALAFFAGCSGAAGRFMPPATRDISSAITTSDSSHTRDRSVRLTMRVPRRTGNERFAALHPSTISPLTRSVGISVNRAAAKYFDTTASSTGCKAGSSATTCSFAIAAPVGLDSFAIATFAGTDGRGRMLDFGVAEIRVDAGTVNSPSVTLGPVVTSTAEFGAGSLRSALAAANAGDTVWFAMPAGSTISLGAPVTLPANVDIAGPGVTASPRARRNAHGLRSNVTFAGVTVRGSAGQVFIVAPGVTAAISGLILEGTTVNNGTLTLVGDAVIDGVGSPNAGLHALRAHATRRRTPNVRLDCSATATYGGGAFNTGTLVVAYSQFDANDSPGVCGSIGYGGAIFNAGALEAIGSTFTNNSAAAGGAVANAGAARFVGDTFTANLGCTAVEPACAVSGCSGYGCASFPYGFGAAIFDGAGPGVRIEKSSFSDNVVGGTGSGSIGEGGALYLAAGAPRIVDSTFSRNVAGGGLDNCSTGFGGAIFEYLQTPGALVLAKDTFSNNAAGGDQGGYGGAVFDENATLEGNDDTFTDNGVFATGSVCQPNDSASGGGVYAASGATFDGTTFNGNTAKATVNAVAGALYVNDVSSLTGDRFTSNATSVAANGNANSAPSAGAGAVYADNLASLQLTNDAFASNNVSVSGATGFYAYGGAIYSRNPLVSSGTTFTGNTAVAAAASTRASAAGGAVWSFGGFASAADTFEQNAALGPAFVFGGAVAASAGFAFTGDTFDGNGATQGQSAPYDCEGGALYLAGSGTVASSAFTGNVAGSGLLDGYGGAIAISGTSGTSAFTQLTVSGNSSTDAGGGLYVDEALTIDRSSFTGNTVSSGDNAAGGGGMTVWAPTVLSNSTISGNIVKLGSTNTISGGGGIWNGGGLSIAGSTIAANSVAGTGRPVTDNGGGGIWSDGTLTMLNSTVTGNQSSVDGGGVAQYRNVAIAVENATLYQNVAAGNGGNIYNPVISQSFTLTNTIVAGGSAGGAGSDVDNEGTIGSGNYNIVAAGTEGNGSFNAGADDSIGSSAKPFDPKLLPLANNGGPTFTNAETEASPGRAAIPFSAGTCNGVAAVDQRGAPRGSGGTCDIGAYEFGGAAASVRLRLPLPASMHHVSHRRHGSGVPKPPAPAHPQLPLTI